MSAQKSGNSAPGSNSAPIGRPDPLRRAALRGLSLAFSILPVAICTLSYFPLWRAAGAAAQISGFAALLLVLSALPLVRLVRRIFASPSVWMLWLFAFLLFSLLSRIAGQMTVIAFTGFLGNGIGAILWKYADAPEKESRNRDHTDDNAT